MSADANPYKESHNWPSGPGDGRPTAEQIILDNALTGALTGKTFLVTGGSNGLGVGVVRQLAKTGAKVFFTSRDLARGEKVRETLEAEAKKEGREVLVEVLEMELGDSGSVRKAAEEFGRRNEGLNVLVNNAGGRFSRADLVFLSLDASLRALLIACTGIGLAPQGRTKDGWETHFGVNHLAHFYLFKLLEPLLLNSSTPDFQSRVISVSSSIHTFGPCVVGDYNLEALEGGYNPCELFQTSSVSGKAVSYGV